MHLENIVSVPGVLVLSSTCAELPSSFLNAAVQTSFVAGCVSMFGTLQLFHP